MDVFYLSKSFLSFILVISSEDPSIKIAMQLFLKRYFIMDVFYLSKSFLSFILVISSEDPSIKIAITMRV